MLSFIRSRYKDFAVVIAFSIMPTLSTLLATLVIFRAGQESHRRYGGATMRSRYIAAFGVGFAFFDASDASRARREVRGVFGVAPRTSVAQAWRPSSLQASPASS